MSLSTHKYLFVNVLVFVLLLGANACSPKISKAPSASAGLAQLEKASSSADWDNLFVRNTGRFGGDGIFAIPMDGAEFRTATESTKTLFVFSDSVVADSIGETILRKDFTMVHNCVAYLDGSEPNPNKFKFYIHKDGKGNPTSLFVQLAQFQARGILFRLGDGFVEENVEMDSTLYLFAYPVKDTIIPGSFFEFDQRGVNLIVIPKAVSPQFKDQRQLETPFHFPLENWNEATMGSGIMVNTTWAGAPKPDGYVYILGVGGTDKTAGIARVKPKEFEQFEKWEFSKGSEWTHDYLQSKPELPVLSPMK